MMTQTPSEVDLAMALFLDATSRAKIYHLIAA